MISDALTERAKGAEGGWSEWATTEGRATNDRYDTTNPCSLLACPFASGQLNMTVYTMVLLLRTGLLAAKSQPAAGNQCP